MHMLRTSLFAALGLGALASVASANGFYINEHDARNTGRAGASTATNTEPSAVIFNPGGIALSEGTKIAITASVITGKGSYFDPGNMDERTDTDTDPAVVPSLFATTRLTDMLAVGAGFHLPFGSSISWPEDHAQADSIQDQTLRTYFITLAVGLNLGKQVPGLSLGAGVDLVPSTVKLERQIIFGETRGRAVLGGDAFGVGARAGVQYRPSAVKQLSLGVMWRAQVNLDYSGNGDFDIDPAFRAQLPPDGEIKTKIRLPQTVALGAAFNATPELQLEANAMWINWSKFDELRIELPGGFDPTVQRQDYEDTITLRFGAEYKLAKAAVRVGYAFDPTPIPGTTISATLPDGDRHVLTAGGSYSLSNFDVHLGLLWVMPATSETSDEDPYMPQFKGKYEVTALVGALSIAGKFGK